MSTNATKLDLSDFIAAPRRSGAIPNSSGSHALFNLSKYSFDTHSNSSGTYVLDLKTKNSQLLSNDPRNQNWKWIGNGSTVLYSRQVEVTTQLWIRDAAKPEEEGYQAGVFRSPVSVLEVSPFTDDSFGILLLGPPKIKDEPEPAAQNYSTGREYSSLPVLGFDQYITSKSKTLWYSRFHAQTAPDHGIQPQYVMSQDPIDVLKGTDLDFDPYSGVIPGGPTNCSLSSFGILFAAKPRGPYQYRTWSSDLYYVPIESLKAAQGQEPVVVLTSQFSGKVSLPSFSPSGKSFAFLRCEDGKKVASKNHILVVDLATNDLTAQEVEIVSSDGECWPLNPESLVWSNDENSLYIAAADTGRQKLFQIVARSSSKTKPTVLVGEGLVSGTYRFSENSDESRLLVSKSSYTESSVFLAVDTSTKEQKIVSSIPFCEEAGLSSSQVSETWFKGAGEYDVHAWVIKPSYFKEGNKYPFALFIHGGPLSSWLNGWSTRWNPVVFAEQGYIVVLPDMTGSIGYGEDFKEAAILDYGGRPYRDLEKCFEYVADNIPFADTTRAVALGGSYGGYLIYWLAGKALGKKFKALVAHDGIFDASTLYSCDVPDIYRVLFGGYDSNPIALREIFDKWDPSRYVENWSTPILIIHSDKDTRHPVSMGLSAFTTLQMKGGVECRYLNFPDEGHFVLKPENSLHWHRTVIGWINKFSGVDGITLRQLDA